MITKKLRNNNDEATDLFSRSDMLQHRDFYQFAEDNLQKPISPHSIHKNLREKIENLGCRTEMDLGPTVQDYWHMTVDNGEISNVEADYITFEGRIRGSIIKLKDWPWWRGFVILIIILTIPTIILAWLIFSWLRGWEQRNPRDERGDLYVLYSGAYQRPEKSNTQIKDWVISLDVMVSYDATDSGTHLVKPVFNSLKSDAAALVSDRKSEVEYSGSAEERQEPKLKPIKLTSGLQPEEAD
jgi:hypothetical protein